MGLDMYLSARKYISNWRDEDKAMQDALKAAVSDSGDMSIKHVICEAAYWRKDNHIHKWFVDNVQNGKDDCGQYYVDREQLQELRNVCEEVMANPDRAKKLLPTQSGFFFGGTNYDQDYFDSLEYTVKRIDLLLNDQYKDWDFEYQASW